MARQGAREGGGVNMKSKITVISLVNPYRPNPNGGSEDIRRRVEALSDYFKVYIYALDHKDQLKKRNLPPQNIKLKTYMRHIDPNPLHWGLPIPALTRYNRQLIKDLLQELVDNDGIILVEGLQCLSIWLSLPLHIRQNKLSVLRVHNIESVYHCQHFHVSKHLFEKIVHYITSIQYRLYEANLLPSFDYLHCISAAEAQSLNGIKGLMGKILFVPPLVSMVNTYKVGDNPTEVLRIGYFGDLSIILNRDGIIWFTQEVIKLINKFKIEIHLAGKGSENIPNLPGVKINRYGFIHDIAAFASKMHVLIAPLRGGAGVKIKVIDFIGLEIPLVATRKAVEGLSTELCSFLWVADSPNKLASYLETIYTDYELALNRAKKAKEILLRDHSKDNYLNLFT